MTTMAEPRMLKVKLVRSAIGCTQRQRQIMRRLKPSLRILLQAVRHHAVDLGGNLFT